MDDEDYGDWTVCPQCQTLHQIDFNCPWCVDEDGGEA